MAYQSKYGITFVEGTTDAAMQAYDAFLDRNPGASQGVAQYIAGITNNPAAYEAWFQSHPGTITDAEAFNTSASQDSGFTGQTGGLGGNFITQQAERVAGGAGGGLLGELIGNTAGSIADLSRTTMTTNVFENGANAIRLTDPTIQTMNAVNNMADKLGKDHPYSDQMIQGVENTANAAGAAYAVYALAGEAFGGEEAGTAVTTGDTTALAGGEGATSLSGGTGAGAGGVGAGEVMSAEQLTAANAAVDAADIAAGGALAGDTAALGGAVAPVAGAAGGIDWGNIASNAISGAASLYGGQLNQDAIDTATGEQRRQYDINRADLEPWRAAGQTALGGQLDLMGLPGGTGDYSSSLDALQNSPGYQFRLGQGVNALDASAAARGGMTSGKAGTALQNYGQNFATGEYGNRLNQLAGLSGTGQSQSQFGANLGANYANNMSNASLMSGQNQASMAQGVGGALSNIFNPQQQQRNRSTLG